MKLLTAIEGNLEKIMKDETNKVEKAVTTSMKRAGNYLKNELRRQVKKADLGTPLQKAWRVNNYPGRGHSAGAASLVYSKATRIHNAFMKGGVVRARQANWMVIPLDPVKALGLHKSYSKSKSSKPRVWSDIKVVEDRVGKLTFIKYRHDRAILVKRYKGKRKPKAYFLLVKQVMLRKTLDMDRPADKWSSRVPGYIVKELDKLDKKSRKKK